MCFNFADSFEYYTTLCRKTFEAEDLTPKSQILYLRQIIKISKNIVIYENGSLIDEKAAK